MPGGTRGRRTFLYRGRCHAMQAGMHIRHAVLARLSQSIPLRQPFTYIPTSLISNACHSLYRVTRGFNILCQIMVTFLSYVSNACHSLSGVAERLQHTNFFVYRLPQLHPVQTASDHPQHPFTPSIPSNHGKLPHPTPVRLHGVAERE